MVELIKSNFFLLNFNYDNNLRLDRSCGHTILSFADFVWLLAFWQIYRLFMDLLRLLNQHNNQSSKLFVLKLYSDLFRKIQHMNIMILEAEINIKDFNSNKD